MLDVTTVSIDDVVPDVENDRAHDERSVAHVRRVLERFGQVAPLLVQAGTMRLIDGHARLQALREAGAVSVDVVKLSLTDEQARVLAIAVNRGPELATWRPGVLQQHLEALDRAGWDLDTLLGWNEAELDELLRDAELAAGEVEDERAPVLPGGPTTCQPGDIWTFPTGHRLICGDSLLPETLERLMGGHVASLVHTDPPYGVSYAADGHDAIANDDLQGDELASFLSRAFYLARHHTRRSAAWYIWHAASTRDEYKWALRQVGLVERQPIIWVKPAPTLGHSDYQYAHEPCIYAAREGERPDWYGDRSQSTTWIVTRATTKGKATVVGNGVLITTGAGDRIHVRSDAPKSKKPRTVRIEPGEVVELGAPTMATDTWLVKRDTTRAHHPTQKPLELPARAMRNSSQPGDIVLDPFLGSGSTLIAAEKLGRKCYGVELDPRRCDQILAWYHRLTGNAPTNQHGVAWRSA